MLPAFQVLNAFVQKFDANVNDISHLVDFIAASDSLHLLVKHHYEPVSDGTGCVLPTCQHKGLLVSFLVKGFVHGLRNIVLRQFVLPDVLGQHQTSQVQVADPFSPLILELLKNIDCVNQPQDLLIVSIGFRVVGLVNHVQNFAHFTKSVVQRIHLTVAILVALHEKIDLEIDLHSLLLSPLDYGLLFCEALSFFVELFLEVCDGSCESVCQKSVEQRRDEHLGKNEDHIV